MIGLGFLSSVSYIIIDPNLRKNVCCRNFFFASVPLSTYFFLGWVGLGLGEFVGFVTILTCFPTALNLAIANTLLLGPSLDLFQTSIPESRKRFTYSPRSTAGVLVWAILNASAC